MSLTSKWSLPALEIYTFDNAESSTKKARCQRKPEIHKTRYMILEIYKY
jgi:hypothetical protein